MFEIENIAIDPQAQQHGIATRRVQSCMVCALQLNCACNTFSSETFSSVRCGSTWCASTNSEPLPVNFMLFRCSRFFTWFGMVPGAVICGVHSWRSLLRAHKTPEMF